MHSYPVYIDGNECGHLTVSTDGLMTAFSAKCSVKSGKIIRLYVCGGGRSAVLGTLSKNGEITRRFSRTELEKLPHDIEYAADTPLSRPSTDTGDTLWRCGKMGCLVSEGLIAIPANEEHLARVSDKLRRIDGRLYLIFERKT